MSAHWTGGTVYDLCEYQKRYFATGMTRAYQARVTVLRALRHALDLFHDELLAAARADFSRVALEVQASELSYLQQEIDYALGHLAHWIEPTRARTTWREWGAHAQIIHEPYGVVVIIAPWNYPYLLSLLPAVHALAAGNTVIIKPSEFAPEQARMIAKIMSFCMLPAHGAVIMGGIELSHEVLAAPVDYIFFTGSTKVGKLVYEQAARRLIPVTLELGGKCPAIVTQHADVQYAARTVVWGKCFNAGQTCVAPDYVVVHRSIAHDFIEHAQRAVKDFYGDDPQQSPDFARSVTQQHSERLALLLQRTQGRVVIGGGSNIGDRYCAPTVVADCSWDDALMREEIFGPILPVLVYDDLEEMLNHVSTAAAPLAAYAFTRDAREQQVVQRRVRAGACVFNDCLAQSVGPELPFGGVGSSGFGRYHGRTGFELLSRKTVIYTRTRTWLQNFFRPPYRAWLKNFF